MDLSGFKLIRLSSEITIKPFDCDDSDLNQFLFNDSKDFLRELLAVTYIIESDDQTVAYFSVMNDKISVLDGLTTSHFNRLRRPLHRRKHFRSYPSVKVGRLAVHKDFQGNGLGNQILNYLKVMFTTHNRTGCKFITVDAYAKSLRFYEKNGFKYFNDTDKSSDTRQMYLMLSPIILSQTEEAAELANSNEDTSVNQEV